MLVSKLTEVNSKMEVVINKEVSIGISPGAANVGDTVYITSVPTKVDRGENDCILVSRYPVSAELSYRLDEMYWQFQEGEFMEVMREDSFIKVNSIPEIKPMLLIGNQWVAVDTMSLARTKVSLIGHTKFSEEPGALQWLVYEDANGALSVALPFWWETCIPVHAQSIIEEIEEVYGYDTIPKMYEYAERVEKLSKFSGDRMQLQREIRKVSNVLYYDIPVDERRQPISTKGCVDLSDERETDTDTVIGESEKWLIDISREDLLAELMTIVDTISIEEVDNIDDIYTYMLNKGRGYTLVGAAVVELKVNGLLAFKGELSDEYIYQAIPASPQDSYVNLTKGDKAVMEGMTVPQYHMLTEVLRDFRELVSI